MWELPFSVLLLLKRNQKKGESGEGGSNKSLIKATPFCSLQINEGRISSLTQTKKDDLEYNFSSFDI